MFFVVVVVFVCGFLPIFLGCSWSSGADAKLLLPVCQSPRTSRARRDSVCRLIVGIYSSGASEHKEETNSKFKLTSLSVLVKGRTRLFKSISKDELANLYSWRESL